MCSSNLVLACIFKKDSFLMALNSKVSTTNLYNFDLNYKRCYVDIDPNYCGVRVS